MIIHEKIIQVSKNISQNLLPVKWVKRENYFG